MHITNEFDDALREWRRGGLADAIKRCKDYYCEDVRYRYEVWDNYKCLWSSDGRSIGRTVDAQRTSSLSHDLAIDYDDALALVKASSSDTAVRLIVKCCVAAHQGLDVGVSILKGAGV